MHLVSTNSHLTNQETFQLYINVVQFLTRRYTKPIKAAKVFKEGTCKTLYQESRTLVGWNKQSNLSVT